MSENDGFEIVRDGILEWYCGEEEVVVIPEGVWQIGKTAFFGDKRIRRVDLSNVEDIDDDAFSGCDSLEGIVLTNHLVEIGYRAFKGCSSLRYVEFRRDETGDDARPANLCIEPEAFADCISLERVDLHLIEGRLTVGDRAFARCRRLTSVKFSDALTDFCHDVFWDCTALECVCLPELPIGSTEQEECAHETALRELKGGCVDLQILETRPELEFASGDGEGPESPLEHAYRSTVRRLAYRDLPDHWKRKGAKCLFQRFSKLEEIDLEGIRTGGEESFACMFKGCAELREIDLFPLETHLAKDLRQMFFGCRSLRALDLSVLDTGRVEDMSHLLHNCRSLERVNLTGLDLSKVRSLWSAFDGCESLTELDLSAVSTPALEKAGYLFRGCSSLRSVDLRGLDLSLVENLSHLFAGCDALERWTVAETWPVNNPDAIPEPTAECGMWWSAQRQEWMTVAQIRDCGPMADTYTSEPESEPGTW